MRGLPCAGGGGGGGGGVLRARLGGGGGVRSPQAAPLPPSCSHPPTHPHTHARTHPPTYPPTHPPPHAPTHSSTLPRRVERLFPQLYPSYLHVLRVDQAKLGETGGRGGGHAAGQACMHACMHAGRHAAHAGRHFKLGRSSTARACCLPPRAAPLRPLLQMLCARMASGASRGSAAGRTWAPFPPRVSPRE